MRWNIPDLKKQNSSFCLGGGGGGEGLTGKEVEQFQLG
jgi:hypothetical protein